MGRSLGFEGVLVRLMCRPSEEVAVKPRAERKRASISGARASESNDSGTAVSIHQLAAQNEGE